MTISHTFYAVMIGIFAIFLSEGCREFPPSDTQENNPTEININNNNDIDIRLPNDNSSNDIDLSNDSDTDSQSESQSESQSDSESKSSSDNSTSSRVKRDGIDINNVNGIKIYSFDMIQ